VFILIGCIGLAVLVLALVFDDALDGLFPDLGWLSMTGIAVFLAAFGFGAWVLDARVGLPTILATAGGLAGGTGLAAVALRWSRALSSMATDATPTAADLVGREGRVITPIPVDSRGEALIRLAGQQLKLTAVASAEQKLELKRGTPVVVVRVLSPTQVEVVAADAFWSEPH
jgi:membrane protein implicated in regulation of membrane protease activity